MKKKLGIVSIALGGTVALSACGGGGGEESGDGGGGGGESNPSELRILTGSEEGAYFPLGGALANNIINENLEDVSAESFTSGGSVVNIDDVAAGDAELGLAQNDVAANAAEGINMYEEEGAVEGFSGIATLYPEVIQIITSADSGIETVSDLEGATVAVGDQGSGTEVNANQILEAHDITYEDISPEYMDFGDAANNIQDGNVDAAFITGGLPTGAVESLNANTDVNIVSIEEEIRNELLEEYSYYTTSTIDADTYGLENDAETLAVRAMLIVNDELDEGLVYDITEAMYENTDAFAEAHQQGGEISEEEAMDGMSIDLHPGAQQYFDEQE